MKNFLIQQIIKKKNKQFINKTKIKVLKISLKLEKEKFKLMQ